MIEIILPNTMGLLGDSEVRNVKNVFVGRSNERITYTNIVVLFETTIRHYSTVQSYVSHL